MISGTAAQSGMGSIKHIVLQGQGCDQQHWPHKKEHTTQGTASCLRRQITTCPYLTKIPSTPLDFISVHCAKVFRWGPNILVISNLLGYRKHTRLSHIGQHRHWKGKWLWYTQRMLIHFTWKLARWDTHDCICGPPALATFVTNTAEDTTIPATVAGE